jgi:hypothetical protein
VVLLRHPRGADGGGVPLGWWCLDEEDEEDEDGTWPLLWPGALDQEEDDADDAADADAGGAASGPEEPE